MDPPSLDFLGIRLMIVRVIDFETTGEKPPEAAVCEVGYCDVDIARRAAPPPVSWLCGVPTMPPEARAVHHISPADCAPFMPFGGGSIVEMDGKSALGEAADIVAYAAHNADFEMQFFVPPAPMICTYKAALRVWPDAPTHSNGGLRYWLEDQGKIQPAHELTLPAHRAGPDAYVTAHILLALLDAGATGKEMAAWTREPPLLPRCPIGKFRGKPWPEVELGFLEWMTRQPDMEEGLKFNAWREIDRRRGGSKDG